MELVIFLVVMLACTIFVASFDYMYYDDMMQFYDEDYYIG